MPTEKIRVFVLICLEITTLVLASECHKTKNTVYGQSSLNHLKLERIGFQFPQEFKLRRIDPKLIFLGESGSKGSIPQHLGHCAVVGLGESLLHQSFGKTIDNFDTVIRFGWQLSFLTSSLGSKSSYVFVRK